MPPLPKSAVRLVEDGGAVYAAGGAIVSYHNPNFGAGVWGWMVASLPHQSAGRYRVRIDFPADGPAPGFTMWLDAARGQPLRDPTWVGQPYEIGGGIVLADLRRPDDFWGLAAVTLDLHTQSGDVAVTDAQVWAGPTPLTTGGGPGVPPALVNSYLGKLQPGAYGLRVVHPRFELPAGSPPIVVDSSALLVARRLVPSPLPPEPIPPVDHLTITVPALFLVKDEFLDARTNLPASFASLVRWETSNKEILRPEEPSGCFRAVAPGTAHIVASYRTLNARVAIAVRQNQSAPVLQPADASFVEVDPVLGVRVVANQVVVFFRAGVSDEEQKKLCRELHLTRAGVSPAVGFSQLTFDRADWNLHGLIDRLRRDSRVDDAVHNTVGEGLAAPASFIPYRPPAVIATDTDKTVRYWSLYKTETFAAFGLLRNLSFARDPQSLIVVDTGLYVSWWASEFDEHFAPRVELPRCKSYVPSVPVVYDPADPATLKKALRSPVTGSGTDRTRHGNAVASMATADWVVPTVSENAVGVDQALKIVMYTVPDVDTHRATAIADAAALANHATRVINISIGTQDLTEADAARFTKLYYQKSVEKLIDPAADLLVVLAAGNHDMSFRTVSLISVRDHLTAAQAASVILVGGTMKTTGAPYDPEGKEKRWVETGGSDYDPAGRMGKVDLAAPGHLLWCSIGDEVKDQAGTSFAAPMVSAAAAARDGGSAHVRARAGPRQEPEAALRAYKGHRHGAAQRLASAATRAQQAARGDASALRGRARARGSEGVEAWPRGSRPAASRRLGAE